MLKVEDFSAWLGSSSPRSVITPIRLLVMPDKPDECVVLSDYGGYPLEVEDAVDVPTLQVRCRGRDGPTARDLAHRIDGLLLNTARPFFVGGPGALRRVFDVGRVGGAPSYLEADDKGRTTYTCNYWLMIER